MWLFPVPGTDNADTRSHKQRTSTADVPYCIDINVLTLSLPSVKFPGSKMHMYLLANSILDGPVTNRLSVLCIWIKIFSCAKVGGGGGGGLYDFKFGTFIGSCQSDGAVSMAVKGLILTSKCTSELHCLHICQTGAESKPCVHNSRIFRSTCLHFCCSINIQLKK